MYTREALHALQGNRCIDGSRAAAELGHSCRPLDESVRDTCAWFAHNGHLPRLRDRFDRVAFD
jgi:nucleoside-diphosphate-sugar epimerase